MNTVKDKSQTVKNVCIKKQEKNTDKIHLKSVHFRKRMHTTQQKVRQRYRYQVHKGENRNAQ